MRKNILVILLSIVTFSSFAADRYWIASSTANWNSTSNWSTTSGGSGGASVPGTGDKAIFDSSGLGRCNITANMSVLHIDVKSTYTDTIFQDSNKTIEVLSGGSFSILGGTFIGGTGNITIRGTFTLGSSALFTSTSGVLNIRGNVTIDDGDDFSHNNGTFTLFSVTGGSTVTVDLDTIILYNFNVNNAAANKSVTFASDNEITVNNDITLFGSTTAFEMVLFGGKFFIKGDVYVEYFRTNIYGQGTTEFIFDGSGNQKIDATGNGAGGSLFKVTIDKSASDTLFLSGTFRVDNNWDHNTGIVSADSTSIVWFYRGAATISGNTKFNSIRFQGISTGITWNISDTLIVMDRLIFVGTVNIRLLGGEIHCKGDLDVSGNSMTTYSGAFGTTKIYFDGTGDQEWIGSSTISKVWMPIVIIDKPSGTLHITNTLSFGVQLHYIAGDIDYGTSTLTFINNCDITGNDFGLYNVWVYIPHNINSAIGLNDTTLLTANGNLILSNSSAYTNVSYFTSGTIHVKGDILLSNDKQASIDGYTVVLNGTGDQTIDGTALYNEGNLANVTIDKPSGTLFLKDYVNVTGTWKYLNGTIDYTTYSNNLVLIPILNPHVIGTHDLGNLIIFRPTGSLTKKFTIRNTDHLTVNGDLTTIGTSLFVIDSGAIEVKGNITVTSGLDGGTGTIKTIGNNNQTFTGTTSLTTGELPNFTMNKSGGTFTVTNFLNVKNVLTLTNGIITTSNSSSKVHFVDNATISGGSKTSYVDGIVSKLGNDAFTFPNGENGMYRPLTMTAPSSTAANFESEYFATKQTLGTSFDTSFAEISSNEYWQFSRTVGTSTVKATMSWSENKFEIPGDSTSLSSLYWNGSSWVGLSNDLLTGNASEGSLRTPTLTTYSNLVFGIKKKNLYYVNTKHKLDGGVYRTKNNRLYVKYIGEYNLSELRFNIYDMSNDIIADQSNPGIVDRFYQNNGDNRLTFNFSTNGHPLTSGYYILEIINDKNEKEYLRFEKL
jgi:hypothetical protein